MHSLSRNTTASASVNGGEFSELKGAQIQYELLKKHSGYPKGSQVQLRVYDVNSQKWKWLGDWNDL